MIRCAVASQFLSITTLGHGNPDEDPTHILRLAWTQACVDASFLLVS